CRSRWPLLVRARPQRLRSHDVEWRHVRWCADSGAGYDRALDRTAERALDASDRMGHTGSTEQRGTLLLATVVRPHRVHRHEHLDGPRTRTVRDPAHEPCESDTQQLAA